MLVVWTLRFERLRGFSYPVFRELFSVNRAYDVDKMMYDMM